MRALVGLLAVASVGCGEVGLDPLNLPAAGGWIEVDPDDMLSFGEVSPDGSPVLDEVLLYSAGDQPVAVVDVYLDEYTSQAFRMRTNLDFLPMRLQPGAELPVKIDFQPYAVGDYAGTVIVLIDENGEEEEIPVDLVGRGCPDNDANGACD